MYGLRDLDLELAVKKVGKIDWVMLSINKMVLADEGWLAA